MSAQAERTSGGMTAEDRTAAVELARKVEVLSRPETYGAGTMAVERRETHMSWVFLTDRHAFKLKKPVSFDAVDYRTLAQREHVCRQELRLNRRLADWVYLDVVALCESPEGTLALDGPGQPVEWLVQMHRLDELLMLDAAIRDATLDEGALDRAVAHLLAFYRAAEPVGMDPAACLAALAERIDGNAEPLLQDGSGLDPAHVRALRERQHALLQALAPQLRARAKRVIEAHGDLRPEHVWLGTPVAIIDCLEFDRDRRLLDPLDELAFLSLECEELGAAWVGQAFVNAYRAESGDEVSAAEQAFRQSLWAVLRTRAAVSHLFDPAVRDTERWRRKAEHYLTVAEAKAAAAERVTLEA